MIGFVTATLDVLHENHVLFLEACRKQCDHLVVGVTTDEVAARQKRIPVCSYRQRAAVARALRCVDTVVAHSGQSKSTMFRQLQFDVLFTSDQYYGSDEFNVFIAEYPAVRVVYLPREPHQSTSNIIAAHDHRVLDTIRTEAYGLQGPLLSFGDRLIKTICIGATETADGRNSYALAVPPPRNKAGTRTPDQPRLNGVNGYREVLVHDQIGGQAWNPYLYHKIQHLQGETGSLAHERAHPADIVYLFQAHAGPTLQQFMTTVPPADVSSVFQRICRTLRRICTQLQRLGIVHGDLHPRNICVKSDGQVCVVDFGWCLSRSFPLAADESAYLESLLAADSDWRFFVDSLPAFGMVDLIRYVPDPPDHETLERVPV